MGYTRYKFHNKTQKNFQYVNIYFAQLRHQGNTDSIELNQFSCAKYIYRKMFYCETYTKYIPIKILEQSSLDLKGIGIISRHRRVMWFQETDIYGDSLNVHFH